MLVMMSGLPGAGKSTVADALGARLPAVVLSVDPIETAIIRSGLPQSFETGLAAYAVGAVLAEHQLRLGLDVIADAANLEEEGRAMWRDAADRGGATVRVIEVVCGEEATHRRRLATRRRGLDGFAEPTWDEVVARGSQAAPWTEDHLVLDSMDDPAANLAAALAHLRI